MYTIEDAPVFQSTFDLIKEYHTIRSKFPKAEKYTLGERIEQSLIAILTAIVEAGHAKKDWKSQSIERALANAELSKILIRLAWEIQLVSEKQYLQLQERLQRIGQMLGGWRRAT